MALVLADRVQETTTTTGTGTVTLAGAVSGYQSFAVIGDGNTTYYTITSGTAWEVGIGTYTSAGTALARTTVLSSSAGGTTPITLAGTSVVFVTYPSEKAISDGYGTLPVANGGTGAITAPAALTNLGAYPSANPSGYTSNTGTVTSVGGTAPVVSSGGTTPAISMAAATASVNGYLTSTDWTTFNNKTTNTGTVTSVGGTGTVSGLTLSGTVTSAGNLTLGGALSLTSLNVTTALGFTPYNATNPSGYTSNTGTATSVGGTGTVSGLTLSGTVTTSGNLTLGGTLSLTSGNVTTALGFTPYNATNPAGYITSSSSITGNAATATTATTATNWGSYGAVPAAGTSGGTPNTILRSNASGYTFFGYINSSTAVNENPVISQVITTNGTDTYYRKSSIAHLTNSLTGTASISVTGSSASTTGNAATATTLQTARTINGVSFNGSADITVADATKLPLTGGTLTGTVTAPTFNATTTTGGAFNGIDADTAAAPSFTWSSDLDSGMWHPATNVVGISAGGNDEFRVYTTYTLSLGSSRAPLFYDNANTAYYLDPASAATSLNVAGSIVAAGNVTAYSDERLKENIETISSALDKIGAIRGVTYTRNDLDDKERRYAGVIAQEIEVVLPEAVRDIGKIKAVDYNATIALLIEAVKELKDEVASLKNLKDK